jgi:cytochrome c oxidase subunit 2
MATWAKISLLDGISPLIEQIVFLHDHIMIVLVRILTIVGYFLIFIKLNTLRNQILVEGQLIETV